MAQMTSSFLIAGGYSPAEQPGLHVLALDEASGELSPVASQAGILNPSFLVLHPNKKWLYVVSETSSSDGSPGGVWALTFDAASGKTALVNRQASGGDWPCHLQLDRTGHWLFVANYGSGTVSVYPIKPDGSLGEASNFVRHAGKGPNPDRQEGPHAHSVTLTPDNNYALVADLGLDQIVVYRFDAATGKMTLHGAARSRPGAGPRHLVFHPNGLALFAANELDGSVSVYAYDPAAGSFTLGQTLDTLPAGAPENTVADIHLSADARRLYVSNRGHNSLAVYAVDGLGGLTRLAITSCGGNWPRNFALAPGGRFVLVANQYTNEVTVLPLNPGGTEVGAPIGRAALPGASCIKFVAAND